MNWFLSNWMELLIIIGILLTLAAAIVKLTPSKKDDEVVGKIQSWYDKIMSFLKKK